VQNLWRMKQLYETYKNNEKLATLLRELPWSQDFLKVILTGTCKRLVRDRYETDDRLLGGRLKLRKKVLNATPNT